VGRQGIERREDNGGRKTKKPAAPLKGNEAVVMA
jgi:hypothetical protein